jgi:hypothetical protein
LETRYTSNDTGVFMRAIEDKLLSAMLHPMLRATYVRALWHGSRVLASIRDGEPCDQYLTRFDYYHKLGNDMWALQEKLK